MRGSEAEAAPEGCEDNSIRSFNEVKGTEAIAEPSVWLRGRAWKRGSRDAWTGLRGRVQSPRPETGWALMRFVPGSFSSTLRLVLGPGTGIKKTCSGHFARMSRGRGRGHLGGGAL